MAFKQFALNERISVTIYKRKSSRSLKLSIASDGTVKMSIPTWTPYQAGLAFAKSRLGWIEAQRQPPKHLSHGQAIGKAHHLHLVERPGATSVKSRVMASEIYISHPGYMAATDPKVQQAAETASIKALRAQAEKLLPQRLAALAETHGFEYGSVTIKRLKGRWGSCDQNKNIVLNLFLMELPWDCIDYVLLHELTHTQILRHGPDFWGAMAKVLPDLKRIRKEMRGHQPVLTTS
ncbi:MAG TPA: SprT family zinc-dependent metalloprotease [Candidatus Saccharimonadales bacterium]